jgi:ferritin-like metal-binding protein YciE
LKERFVNFVQDVFVMENMLIKPVERYTEEFKKIKNFPEFQAKMYNYIDMNKKQITRIEDRVKFYNKQPVIGKFTPDSFVSEFVNCFTTVRPEPFAGYVNNFYAIEHFKIGLYRLLTTMAQAVGDKETLRVAEFNLRENIEIERWVFEHIPEVCLYTLEFEKIPVPQTTWDFAKQLELVGITSPYTTPLVK